MIFVGNLALAFSVGKGRSCNHAMLRANQKIGALRVQCLRWAIERFEACGLVQRRGAHPEAPKGAPLRPAIHEHFFSLEKKVVKRVEPVRMTKAMKKEVKSLGCEECTVWDEGKRAQKGKLTM